MGRPSPHLPPGGHLVSAPTPPGPRPLHTAAMLTLLALTAAVAIWAIVQLATHDLAGPSPRRAALNPSGTSHGSAPRTAPAATGSSAPRPPGASPVTAPHDEGQNGGQTGGQTGEPNGGQVQLNERPPQEAIPPPGVAPVRPGPVRPHRPPPAPRPPHSQQAPPSPPKPKPKPKSAAAPSWIQAECARRFPDATRRNACVRYLRQTLGP